jgi:glycosyltransferase involved in cell wall biosynthesis
MRILIIKQLFNPEPTAKSLDFAKELISRGHQVEVLTGFPSYPLGKIYPGYKQGFYKREVMEGVSLIRVPIFPSHSSSGLKRFLNYFSYAISATFIGLFLVKKPDVCFVYQGAIPAAIPAIILKKFRGIQFLYDINDLWPDTVATSGMLTNKLALKTINAWCNLNYRNAGFITVCTPGFRKKLILKGVPESKLEVVSNWSRDKIDNSTLSKEVLDTYFKEDKINILYAGNLGIVQSLTTILSAAKQLLEQGNTQIQFVFLGGGADQENLHNTTAEWNLSNVKFISRVESDQVSKYLNAADFLLVHLKKDPLFTITIPSKILAYLKSGKPILMGLEGDARDILEEAQAGYAFEPDNVNDLLVQINKITALSKEEQRQLGNNAKAYYDRALSLESSVDKLERNLENLCKK